MDGSDLAELLRGVDVAPVRLAPNQRPSAVACPIPSRIIGMRVKVGLYGDQGVDEDEGFDGVTERAGVATATLREYVGLHALELFVHLQCGEQKMRDMEPNTRCGDEVLLARILRSSHRTFRVRVYIPVPGTGSSH